MYVHIILTGDMHRAFNNSSSYNSHLFKDFFVCTTQSVDKTESFFMMADVQREGNNKAYNSNTKNELITTSILMTTYYLLYYRRRQARTSKTGQNKFVTKANKNYFVELAIYTYIRQ